MTYEEFISQWRDGSRHIVCNTSGSTGKPKEIFLPKTEMEKSALRTIRFFNLDSRSHLHSCISPDYIGGKMMAVRSESLGAHLTWERPSNRPLSGYRGEKIDLLALVPSQMDHILTHPEEMPEIRHIIIGGSSIPPHLRRKIAASGLDAWETYGMTETASHIALRRVSENEEAFTALDGIHVSLSEDGRLVIEMEGWQRIEANDIARINEDGSFEVLGRADNVIISGGKKIHPEHVEEILERELGAAVLITSEPDEKWGERVVMLIEDEGHISDSEIISAAKSNLPSECVPKTIRHESITRTPNGKKSRRGYLNAGKEDIQNQTGATKGTFR